MNFFMFILLLIFAIYVKSPQASITPNIYISDPNLHSIYQAEDLNSFVKFTLFDAKRYKNKMLFLSSPFSYMTPVSKNKLNQMIHICIMILDEIEYIYQATYLQLDSIIGGTENIKLFSSKIIEVIDPILFINYSIHK